MGKNIKHIFAFGSGLICFIVYFLTLHPSVGFIDCGELAAVCYTFGVPHPTGYPLFLILGYVFPHLPLPRTVIYKLNLLSAIESAAVVIVTFYSVVLILENLTSVLLKPKSKSKGSQKDSQHISKITDIDIYLTAFFTAIACGLTKTFWFDATQIEVYALHSLFISILVYYSLKIIFNIKHPDKKSWALLFLFFGLSCANHSTTIYFIPGIIYLFYPQFKENKVFAKSVLIYLLLVIPGGLLYVILVIIASSEPYFNWSNPQNLNNLMNHLRGSDFSQLMFSSSANFSSNAGAFFKGIIGELAVLPAIFGIVGIVALWKINKKLFVFTLLLILTCLLYSFNYNTIEIGSFYLLVYYLIALFVSLGIIYIIMALGTANMKPKIIAAGIIICAVSIAYNFKENDNSSNYVNEDITLNTLNSIEPNAILLTYDYAFVYSASLYFQQVEKVRQDVKVFIVKFLAAPWYLEMIKKYYPDVYSNIKSEAEDYMNSYSDEKASAPKLLILVKAFLDKNAGKFPVYVTIDFTLSKEVSKFLNNYLVQPDGLVYKLRGKNGAYDSNAGLLSLNAIFRKYEPQGYHKNKVYVTTSGVYYETAFYHYQNKNSDIAIKFLDKSLSLNSSFKEAVNLKNKILSERK